MLRHTICAGLTLFALGTRGERIEAAYREGVETALTRKDTFSLVLDDSSSSVNGEEIPSDPMDETHSQSVETIVRSRDRVLATEQGRPTHVRRAFVELLEKTLEDGVDSEKTGPLEGRVLLLEESDGDVTVDLEDDGERVDDQYLEGHRLTDPSDAMLPSREVALGDSWEVEDDAMRELLGIDASGPALFEHVEVEQDLFEVLGEGSAFAADVEFAAVEEREGHRCAVLAFTYELEAEKDVSEALGMEPDPAEELSCVFDVELRGEGRLWWSIEEGRAVAMEHGFEGSLEIQVRSRATTEEGEWLMQDDKSCSLEGQGSLEWSAAE